MILDNIIRFCDPKTRVGLWGASRALNDHLNGHFYRHVAFSDGYVSISDDPRWRIPLLLPTTDAHGVCALQRALIGRHCRVIDFVLSECFDKPMASCHAYVAILLAFAGAARTLRAFGKADLRAVILYGPPAAPPVPNLVISAYCKPTGDGSTGRRILHYSIPYGPKRVVLNITYTKADHLLWSNIADPFWESVDDLLDAFSGSVDDLVLHFKCVASASKAQRYRNIDVESTVSDACSENVFVQLARCATAICKAECDDNCNDNNCSDNSSSHHCNDDDSDDGSEDWPLGGVPGSLTLVGIDEFDAVCSKEVSLRGHPAKPIAKTFLDCVAGRLTDDKKHLVHERIKILPSAEYTASLSA